MKKLLAAVLLCTAIAGSAQAGTLAFPSDTPVATMTFPDDWRAEETDTGIQAFSPDDVVALYVDVTDMASREDAVRDSFKFLSENGVAVDPASDESSQGALNGMEGAFHNFDGTDADGPVSIGIHLLKASEKNVLVMTYWGTKGEQNKFNEQMGSILNSLKPAAP